MQFRYPPPPPPPPLKLRTTLARRWWFGQNGDLPYDDSSVIAKKFTPIPIGLNCYDQGAAMEEFYRKFYYNNDYAIAKHEKLLFFVNFSVRTNEKLRSRVKRVFCEDNNEYSMRSRCVDWSGYQGKRTTLDTDSMVRQYVDVAKFKFVICPFGHGRDTHRVWEALMVGSVPVVERSGTVMDELYEGLPVLVVGGFGPGEMPGVGELERLWEEEFMVMFERDEVRRRMRRAFWMGVVERKRSEVMEELGFTVVGEERGQCWGWGL